MYPLICSRFDEKKRGKKVKAEGDAENFSYGGNTISKDPGMGEEDASPKYLPVVEGRRRGGSRRNYINTALLSRMETTEEEDPSGLDN